MTPERTELLARVMAFDIDGGAPLPFAARLARENGWTRAYADRVVVEYKRFMFLAATGARPVCPSEDVDAAWHLHLTYTRSYWGRFCGEVLGRPLHHDPTRGGPSEAAKHTAMYDDTLAAYRDAFGHAAPGDVWPAAAERFGDDTRHRAVNTARNWVVPKAPVKRAALLTVGFATVAVLVPGCEGNPFALKNKEFLTLLLVAFVAALIVGRIVRTAMRKPNAQPGDEERRLDWEQTAYLAGEAPRLVTAVIARLVGRGLARVGDDGKTLYPAGSDHESMSAVEKAARAALPVSNDPTALKPVQDAVEAAFAPRAEQLEKDGLVIPVAGRVRIGLAALIPPALVALCLALPRFVTGVLGGHPVNYIVGAVMATAFVSLFVALAGSLRLSNRGRALLAGQLEHHRGLRAGTGWHDRGGDPGMAVALFGTAALAGTALVPLQTWYPRQSADASPSGCSSSGCSTSDSSGSGCSGGSGCGGGGCGGGGD